MSTSETQKMSRWCWRKDLAAFRGLTDRERTGFLLVLEWFENYRLRYDLPAGREAARSFWREEVLGKGRQRETWQLEQWEDAITWYPTQTQYGFTTPSRAIESTSSVARSLMTTAVGRISST